MNYYTHHSISLIAFIMLLVSTASIGQNNSFIDQPYIEVTGTAHREVVPDEIYLQITLKEKDNKGKESIEVLESKMIKKLKALGIDIEKQLVVKDLASNFQFYFLQKTDVFATKEYEVMVKDAATAGRVITELQRIDISNIAISKVDHSQMEKLTLEVKQEAIKKAQEKAKALAEVLGQKIGKAIHIQEFENISRPYAMQGKAAGIMIRGESSFSAGNNATPNINFEKIPVDEQVHVTFILE